MRRVLLFTGLITLTSCAAFGQAATESPTFEVASVKPAEPQPPGTIRIGISGGPGTPDPGQLTCTNVSLKNLLMKAYAVKGYQLNGPKWLDSDRFDIAAKIPMGATKEQFQQMLQNLLAERFKLALHHETKELPLYALVVGKGGSKLKESVDDEAKESGAAPTPAGVDRALPAMPRVKMGADGMPQLPASAAKNGMMTMMMNGRLRAVGNRQPVGALTELLGNVLGVPVVDNTGLKANYDFTLDFAPDSASGPMGMMAPPPPQHDGGPGSGAPMASAADLSGPSIFTALQEQLGLKLEQRKGPVDLLVIDRAEKVPTEN